jgi:lipopolysaccharide export system protein LptA
MQKKYLKLFLPLPLIACSFAAGNLVASCANNSKITITSSSNSPVLSHKGDAVILTANVSNNYAHIIT